MERKPRYATPDKVGPNKRHPRYGVVRCPRCGGRSVAAMTKAAYSWYKCAACGTRHKVSR